jgi:beta-glucosidase
LTSCLLNETIRALRSIWSCIQLGHVTISAHFYSDHCRSEGKNMKRRAQVFFVLICIACATLHAQSTSSKDRVESIIGNMSLEEKIDYIGGTGFAIRAVPSQHLPALEMSDGPLGVRSNSRSPSTVYAAGIGLAATWNRGLAERVGEGIGRDARAREIHFMLGPGLNIHRSPRNGRNFEYFGEEPFLASTVAVGYITGM